MNEPSVPGCLAFLRDLEGHASRTAAGEARPEHALACASCARRLRFAMSFAHSLRQRPFLPAELASPQFLEQIHEQIVQSFEGASTGSLRAAIRGECTGHEIPRPSLPWPLQSTKPVIEELLRSVPGPGEAPALLWPKVRQHVGAVAGRSPRTMFRRVGAVAASVALFAVIGWKFGQEQGTSANIPIVFVTAAELPPSLHLTLLHPTAVLREGPVRN